MENKYWGYHLLLDCGGCNHQSITNPNNIIAFVKELVREIDMVPYGEPTVAHFATHDPEKAGWTLTQLIETSHISAHFVDKDDHAYIDIFSCKPYDADKAIEVVNKYFQPTNVRRGFLNRQAYS